MALSLVTNPLIAMNMSPEDYAITGYFTAYNSLFTPFITFYFLHYYTKRFFELGADDRRVLKATIFKSLLYFSLVLCCIALLILFVYLIH